MTDQSDFEWTTDNLLERFPDASIEHLPSKYQQLLWTRFIEWDEGVSDEGDWLGTCPICRGPAVFNFSRGVLRCEADPCCHSGKRAMSLTNVLLRIHREE